MAPQLAQDYLVYQQGDTFHVRGRIDGNIVKQTKRANEAIQYAIQSVPNEGGEVRLASGDFPLVEPVQLSNNLWLRGSGRGTRLIVENSNETGVGLLAEGLKGAIISDLSVRSAEMLGTRAGIVLDQCGDCQVRDVLSQDFAEYGIWVRNRSFLCEIKSCKLANNGKANIYINSKSELAPITDFIGNLISNCITYGGGTGIECERALVLNIIGCLVYQPGKHAYHLHRRSNSVQISGCRSFQVEEHAVFVESSNELNVSSNVFCWHRGDGIVLRNVSWAAINGNEFIDQGVRARDGKGRTAVVLSEGTQGVQVVGNTIFNWGDQVPMRIGIHEDDSCHNNLIQGNNINFFTDADIVSAGWGTKIGDNVSEKEHAYVGMNDSPVPDFTREQIQHFLQR